jgi:hypothetical protein
MPSFLAPIYEEASYLEELVVVFPTLKIPEVVQFKAPCTVDVPGCGVVEWSVE